MKKEKHNSAKCKQSNPSLKMASWEYGILLLIIILCCYWEIILHLVNINDFGYLTITPLFVLWGCYRAWRFAFVFAIKYNDKHRLSQVNKIDYYLMIIIALFSWYGVLMIMWEADQESIDLGLWKKEKYQ